MFSENQLRMIKKVVRITTNQDQSSDYDYSRPIAERLNAVEMLRQSYLSLRTDAPTRLQRVYQLTQQSRS